MNHRQQIGKIDALGIAEANHHEAFISGRNIPRDKWITRIHRRHALKIDVRARELRHDVVDVIVHAPQNGLRHRLGRVAAHLGVAVHFLDPLKIDDWHHANQ